MIYLVVSGSWCSGILTQVTEAFFTKPSINQSLKMWSKVSAFMCSGKESQIWGPSDLRLFVPYVFVFVLTMAILFGCLVDEEHKLKKDPTCTLNLNCLVFKKSPTPVFDNVLFPLMVY